MKLGSRTVDVNTLLNLESYGLCVHVDEKKREVRIAVTNPSTAEPLLLGIAELTARLRPDSTRMEDSKWLIFTWD